MNCVHCNDAATMRCLTHRQILCRDGYCLHLHRWDGTERCCLVPLSSSRVDWVDIAVAAVTLFAVVLGATMVVVHYGGQ